MQHHTERVNAISLHYVTMGEGEPVLLLAGWPQTWFAWRKVMPLLAAQNYHVVALDLRGLGESEKTEGGYDTRTVASDCKALIDRFGWNQFNLVGHDVGAWVAYAYAAAYGSTTRRVALLDAAIPGITPIQAFGLSRESKTWQFVFHAVPNVPEMLTDGREREYLSWFFRTKSFQPDAIAAEAVNEYVRCYSKPGAMRAGFEYYRAVFDDIAQNEEYSKIKLAMPVLALGGETATGNRIYQTAQQIAENVRGGMVPFCGHYIPEERPEYLADQLLKFFREA